MKQAIHILQEGILRDFDRVNRFFLNTRLAYLMARSRIKEGHAVSFDDPRFAASLELVAHIDLYENRLLPIGSMLQALGAFEIFLFDLLRILLRNAPEAISDHVTVERRWILEAATREEILDRMIDEELHRLRPRTVKEWFTYIEERAEIGYPDEETIGRIDEMFAAKDVFLKGDPRTDERYLNRAGRFARAEEHGREIDISQAYFLANCRLLRTVADRFCRRLLTRLEEDEARAPAEPRAEALHSPGEVEGWLTECESGRMPAPAEEPPAAPSTRREFDTWFQEAQDSVDALEEQEAPPPPPRLATGS